MIPLIYRVAAFFSIKSPGAASQDVNLQQESTMKFTLILVCALLGQAIAIPVPRPDDDDLEVR